MEMDYKLAKETLKIRLIQSWPRWLIMTTLPHTRPRGWPVPMEMDRPQDSSGKGL